MGLSSGFVRSGTGGRWMRARRRSGRRRRVSSSFWLVSSLPPSLPLPHLPFLPCGFPLTSIPPVNLVVLPGQFPDPAKAKNDMDEFADANENRLIKLLKSAMDPQTDLKTLVKINVSPFSLLTHGRWTQTDRYSSFLSFPHRPSLAVDALPTSFRPCPSSSDEVPCLASTPPLSRLSSSASKGSHLRPPPQDRPRISLQRSQ